MKIRSIVSLAAIAALSGVAAVASAQTNGPTGLSARVGIFLPTDRFATDISATWFNFGLDYKISKFNVSAPAEGLQSYLGLSADYYAASGTSNVPIALTYNLRQNNFVYSAGIGADFYNLDDVNETGTSLGGQVGVAYEFGNAGRVDKPLFVQAKYFITRKSQLNGFGIYFGVRF